MLSAWPGVIPIWSMCAEYTTYSCLSLASLPSRMPTVFGAVVYLSFVAGSLVALLSAIDDIQMAKERREIYAHDTEERCRLLAQTLLEEMPLYQGNPPGRYRA